MNRFTKQLNEVGELASKAITEFMDGKMAWTVPGYELFSGENADDVEVDDNWPTFDSLGGDMNTLIAIQNTNGDIIIHAILRMDHLSNEFVEYGFGDLPVQALCRIADALCELKPTPAEECLRNIVNAYRNYDSISLEKYLEQGDKILGDPA